MFAARAPRRLRMRRAPPCFPTRARAWGRAAHARAPPHDVRRIRAH
ncbi:hypothetical protein BURPS668_1725 [Burkholderia pseudomallei 668]|nr:hypothetical protein BURPS668_1725 [Burkholderia pseudomallei 668]